MSRPKTSNQDIKAWADYLEELLQTAKQALGKADTSAITAVHDELYEFDTFSPKGAKLLDEIAIDAAANLCDSDLTRALASITERDHEFADVYALISAATPPPGG